MSSISTKKLELRDLRFSYGSHSAGPAFTLTELTVLDGEIIFLHGRSGSGKTTFLNLLSGVQNSEIGYQVRQSVGVIAYVMHEDTLLPWKSVRGNLEIEAALRRQQPRIDEFHRMCSQWGLPDVGGLLPRQLSLGMRQRVEICKALSFEPDLLLLDEAFAGIDTSTKSAVFSELHRRATRGGISIIATAHQIVDVLKLATKIYLVEDGTLGHCLTFGTGRPERLLMKTDRLLELPEALELLERDLMSEPQPGNI